MPGLFESFRESGQCEIRVFLHEVKGVARWAYDHGYKGFIPHGADTSPPTDGHTVEVVFAEITRTKQEPLIIKQIMWFENERFRVN